MAPVPIETKHLAANVELADVVQCVAWRNPNNEDCRANHATV